jgi:hypothetical protein
MFIAFLFLLFLVGGIGVLVWLGAQRIIAHARECPEARKAIAEHILAPLFSPKKPKEDEDE